MIDWLIDCLKVSEVRNFLKVKWEGIKGLSQTFIFAFWSPWIQILFITKPWREDDMTSSIYLNDMGCWKYLNFIWKIFPILKLYATQWPTERVGDFVIFIFEFSQILKIGLFDFIYFIFNYFYYKNMREGIKWLSKNKDILRI